MRSKPWQLDRRSFLKGLGVACALPYLECMAKAVASNSTLVDGTIPKRLCYLYIPNGVGLPPADSPYHDMWNWFPKGEGEEYQLTQTLAPLEKYRNDISILGGLSHPRSRYVLGHIAGDTWLTGGDVTGGTYQNSISADQVAAHHLSQFTRYPSLTLSTDGGVGYKSRVSTLSFDASGKPIPSEHRQREIFERYFSPSGGSTTKERRKQLHRGKKIVDLVLDDSKSLMMRLGYNDKQKMDEYMTSLNRVEEQVVRSEKWLDVPMKHFDASHINFDADPRADAEAYIRSILDLIVLGFQVDATRVMTYMMAREDGMGFGDSFPTLALGINKGHHNITHDKSADHWKDWGRYDHWLTKQLAYFIEQMKNTRDEYGPVLDNTLVLYGSACSSTHNATNYPLVLAGGKNLGVKHGSYTVFDQDHVLMSNLLLSMLNAVGIPMDRFSDSTGKLPSVIV
ncbi:MAG: DUF1552 domain-containing protein [Coraliomargaritaceae bacterium]